MVRLLKSVTRGQCDDRPTVTFPAAERHFPLTGILHSAVYATAVQCFDTVWLSDRYSARRKTCTIFPPKCSLPEQVDEENRNKPVSGGPRGNGSGVARLAWFSGNLGALSCFGLKGGLKLEARSADSGDVESDHNF